jgi:transposase, IS6 family
MMQERGVEVDPSTILRWVHGYAPDLEKRVRAYQAYGSTSWRVDETCVKVGGRWKYLFRAVDKHGVLIDFMLSDRRNTLAAHRFLAKALTVMRNWPSSSITTDKLRSYPEAIERLKRKELLPVEIMRTLRRGHCLTCKQGVHNEIRFVNGSSKLPHDRQTRNGYVVPQLVNATVPPHLQATRERRGPIHQQAIRCFRDRRLIQTLDGQTAAN